MNNLLRLYGSQTSEDKQVLEKDMLFATLDTSVRKIAAPDHRPFLLTDSVGFISVNSSYPGKRIQVNP